MKRFSRLKLKFDEDDDGSAVEGQLINNGRAPTFTLEQSDDGKQKIELKLTTFL